MADFNEPHKDQEYLTLLASVRTLLTLVSSLLDSRGTDPDNKITYTKRWEDTAKRLEEWSGSQWSPKVMGLTGGGTGASTASGARTNLDVLSESEVDTKVGVHNADYDAHSATSAATANRIIVRDGVGCAKVHTPNASTDIALKSTVDDHAVLTFTAHGATTLPTINTIVCRDGSGKIQVATPTDNAHATRKDYVDGLVAAEAALRTAGDNTKTRAKFVTNAGYPNMSNTTFNIDTLAGWSTWYSVGPTGGGATHEWDALDGVPTDVDWIEISGYLSDSSSGLTSNSDHFCYVYARRNGTSHAWTINTMIGFLILHTDNTGKCGASMWITRRIPVSSRKFDLLKVRSNSGTTPTFPFFLTGWGYNPT